MVNEKRKYRDYLSSGDFDRLRMECNREGMRCFICEKKYGYKEPHHLHYENLGDEKVGVDVIPLCHRCHKKAQFRFWFFRVPNTKTELTRRYYLIKGLFLLFRIRPMGLWYLYQSLMYKG